MRHRCRPFLRFPRGFCGCRGGGWTPCGLGGLGRFWRRRFLDARERPEFFDHLLVSFDFSVELVVENLLQNLFKFGPRLHTDGLELGPRQAGADKREFMEKAFDPVLNFGLGKIHQYKQQQILRLSGQQPVNSARLGVLGTGQSLSQLTRGPLQTESSLYGFGMTDDFLCQTILLASR